jgi:hypothetical protein
MKPFSDRYIGQRVAIIGFLIAALFTGTAFLLKASAGLLADWVYNFLRYPVWAGLITGFAITGMGVILSFIAPFAARNKK